MESKDVSESRIALQRILSEANMNEPIPSMYYNAYIRPIENDLDRLEKQDKVIEIIIKHKLLNYVFKNKKCANMYHLTDEELDILRKEVL